MKRIEFFFYLIYPVVYVKDFAIALLRCILNKFLYDNFDSFLRAFVSYYRFFYFFLQMTIPLLLLKKLSVNIGLKLF